jgi:hypothetical protein
VAVTNGLVLPIPELTDTADGPDAISDLANAVEDYFFDRILPPGVTRWSTFHWGSGASFPTVLQGAKVGDLYYHTGLACTMRAINPGATTPVWRQAEPAIVASKTARDAVSTNYSALLYEGFEIHVQTVAGPPVIPGNKYRWSGSAWTSLESLPRVLVTRTSATSAPGSTETILAWDVASTSVPSRLIIPENGEYDLWIAGSWALSANPGGLAMGARINGSLNTQWIDLRPSQPYYFSAQQGVLKGLQLVANDYVEFTILQNSDSSRAFTQPGVIPGNPQPFVRASVQLAVR